MERPETAESELPAAYYVLHLRLVWLTEHHYTYSDDSDCSFSSPKSPGPLSGAQHEVSFSPKSSHVSGNGVRTVAEYGELSLHFGDCIDDG